MASDTTHGTAAEPGSALSRYYQLAKPGIVYGNVFTTIAAFIFALRWHFSTPALDLLIATIVGIALVIGSAGVFNNYLDRHIDKKMARTAGRPLAAGTISVRAALIYGTLLLLAGLAMLAWSVNILTAEIALFGFVTYVGIYTPAKRKTEWGALIGSIPGAVPIVAGYTAVTGQLDVTALILFIILVCWQMPHFYGIALYRLDDYQAAGVPVLSARRSASTVKLHIVGWIIAYLIAVSLLFTHGFASYSYLILVFLFGFSWLGLAVRDFSNPNSALWGKKVFRFSLIVLVMFCVTLAIAPLLP